MNEDPQSFVEVWGGALFRMSFVAPTLNPFFSNLIREFPTTTVYGKIYQDLKDLDLELADNVTASIMF